MAVNTAIPDAASSFQRSSQTRRDASTTSNGAGSNAMAGDTIGQVPRAGAQPHGDRSSDDAGRFELVDLGAGEAEAEQEFVVVLAEQRGRTLVESVGAS